MCVLGLLCVRSRELLKQEHCIQKDVFKDFKHKNRTDNSSALPYKPKRSLIWRQHLHPGVSQFHTSKISLISNGSLKHISKVQLTMFI